ncbi:hypothetical protein [Cystobacter ferrugineus]|uniref:Vegetative protein n=1 Tax=Cystobacter ferrugineus TaxID=83449 RepID=A0A1L9B2A0_9BACT|nr:hypothetical protein [Cystobacter ferrugineus]OJH36388.1 hypothetical protein BON30_31935 [Cystobacter ferrugineus]
MSIEKPLREMVQAELKTRLAPMHKAIVRMDERLGVIAEIVDIIHRLAPLATRMQTLQMALPGIGLPIQGRGRPAAPPPAPAPAPAPAPRQAAPRQAAPRQAATPPPPPAAPSSPARPPLSYPTSRYALPTAAPVYRLEPTSPAPAPAPRGRPPAKAAAETPSARVSEGGRRCAVIGCKRPARSKGYCSAHYQKLRLLVKSGRRPANWVDDAPAQSVAEVVLPRGRAASKARGEAATPAPAPTPVRPEPPKPKVWVRKKGAKDAVAPLH